MTEDPQDLTCAIRYLAKNTLLVFPKLVFQFESANLEFPVGENTLLVIDHSPRDPS